MKYLKSVMYFIVHLSLDRNLAAPVAGLCVVLPHNGKTALGGSELFGGFGNPLMKAQ